MKARKPIRVAVIGSGCASIAAAFELTRPEHRGKYHVTIYQMGWRMGGKAASGRGPAGRIEEHGLHVWLGFYENAFRLLRECYEELNKTSGTMLDWKEAFILDHHVGMADRRRKGSWLTWTAHFPPSEGFPGDPLLHSNPFSLSNYLARATALLRTLILSVTTSTECNEISDENLNEADASVESTASAMTRLLRYGLLATTGGLIQALTALETILRTLPAFPQNLLLQSLESISSTLRCRFEADISDDDEVRCRWEIIDLVMAILVGAVRFGLLVDSKGLDAINDYDCREWLRMNGASERSVNGAFVRALYDLALAYEGGDPARPGLAAGQALRGSLRMFFTYRGALFWKMRVGMGDVVFAPFYEVLKQRGVTFKFFHRLEKVKLPDPDRMSRGDKPYVQALQFHVQARTRNEGEYEPLITVNGKKCWPSQPDYEQLLNGGRMLEEGRDFESHWDRRKTDTLTLRVVRDFDFVVLGISIGAVAQVCGEIIARDPRWRAMIKHVKTVATQSFQIWMREDMSELGWPEPPVTLSGFVKPFETWSDMAQCALEEEWPVTPRSVAYFCSTLSDPSAMPTRADREYPKDRSEEVRRNAIDFLNSQIHHLWPNAVTRPGRFRWDLLVDPQTRKSAVTHRRVDETRFSSQYWRANVNPTDRYVLALPGSLKYRISPLDNTYDNLTIAGDWTDCGFNEGCVEAAVMSGRLAAHAISGSPGLEEIIGYDHP